IITRTDIDEKYNQEIKKYDISLNLASSLIKSNTNEEIQLFDEYVIKEIDIPKSFIGKTIKDIDIRNRFKIEIVLIKTLTKRRQTQVIVPTGNYKFSEADRIVISGIQTDINKFKMID
ncbi:MAG TPA: TrkA C-terminal domain-containing protein, partial [Candidatus Kapabacteria bacterium]|nr:TrkA C-terminal domain-containing protein [Candidatus Kapabacteria bacterium]